VLSVGITNCLFLRSNLFTRVKSPSPHSACFLKAYKELVVRLATSKRLTSKAGSRNARFKVYSFIASWI
jgi:hypothetical protein